MCVRYDYNLFGLSGVGQQQLLSFYILEKDRLI